MNSIHSQFLCCRYCKGHDLQTRNALGVDIPGCPVAYNTYSFSMKLSHHKRCENGDATSWNLKKTLWTSRKSRFYPWDVLNILGWYQKSKEGTGIQHVCVIESWRFFDVFWMRFNRWNTEGQCQQRGWLHRPSWYRWSCCRCWCVRKPMEKRDIEIQAQGHQKPMN